MATGQYMFSHNDRRNSTGSDDQTSSAQNHRFVNSNTNSTPPRPGQHLDDADLLAWKHQYINIGLREQNVMSNSADDLTQLIDHIPFEGFGQDYNDVDDEELHFDNGTYDYETSIRERLKKANEDLKQDETPVELKHKQRVSFDAVVKAVDIEQDSQELDNLNSLSKPPISPVPEETSTNSASPQSENNSHEYTVPLNDTQPKEGPSLLQQLKALQFHGIPMTDERWPPKISNPTNGSSSREEDSSATKSNSHNNSDIPDTSDMTTKSSSSSQKSMVVSINGGFELQNEDDYIAKGQVRYPNDEKTNSTSNKKDAVVQTPPPPRTETKPQRPHSSFTRPKSSDSSKRKDFSNNITSKSLPDNTNKSTTINSQRPKSAGVTMSLESFITQQSSGVDFVALNRKTAAEKREKEQEERRKKKEAEAKRKIQLEKAKESFEKWVHDKDAERKRLSEEKRLEQEEHEAREAECGKELAELRDKKYQEWIERKNREVLLVNEFKKLQAEDEELASGGGSSSSIHKLIRRENHRAFRRWLRRKYEQSKEEQRQLQLETRRLRRRQRRSIKRFQLQQDLQLAKSFGYS